LPNSRSCRLRRNKCANKYPSPVNGGDFNDQCLSGGRDRAGEEIQFEFYDAMEKFLDKHVGKRAN